MEPREQADLADVPKRVPGWEKANRQLEPDSVGVARQRQYPDVAEPTGFQRRDELTRPPEYCGHIRLADAGMTPILTALIQCLVEATPRETFGIRKAVSSGRHGR
jgi:hypothetical protein